MASDLVEKVTNRLETVRSEIKRVEGRLETLEAEERDLEGFLRIAGEFIAPGEQPQPQPQAQPQPRPSARSRLHGHSALKREPGTIQTEIASEIIRHFKPGDIITARDAAQRLSDKFRHPQNKIERVHYVSNYLNKEAQHRNGILERMTDMPRGHYRIKEHPELYLEGNDT